MSIQLRKGISLDKVKRRVGVTDYQLGEDIKSGFASVTSAGARFNYMTPAQVDSYSRKVAARAAEAEAQRHSARVDDSRHRDLAEAEELRLRAEALERRHD